MIQAFCGYLRIMFALRWMDAKCQPIAIANVVEYMPRRLGCRNALFWSCPCVSIQFPSGG
jgi:hypothetical protein